jgi:VIT1/CCC1 family predicted Fe2+/Mn2+ transporter
MTANIGTIDRALRVLIGIALLALAFGGFVPALGTGAPQWIAVVAGVVMLATAGMRFCLLYRIFGIRTCQR